MKLELNSFRGDMFENVDGRRTTDAGVIGILLAHLRAFGSGMLKRYSENKGWY